MRHRIYCPTILQQPINNGVLECVGLATCRAQGYRYAEGSSAHEGMRALHAHTFRSGLRDPWETFYKGAVTSTGREGFGYVTLGVLVRRRHSLLMRGAKSILPWGLWLPSLLDPFRRFLLRCAVDLRVVRRSRQAAIQGGCRLLGGTLATLR